MTIPAARIGDLHVCPMVTGVVPHVGGPIVAPAAPTVLIGGAPVAGIGSTATCVGPPDLVSKGSSKVLVGNKPCARITDLSGHGGVVTVGCPKVLIGG